MNKTKLLDQFFTKIEISEKYTNYVLKILKEENFNYKKSLFIEPSAGYGCFLDVFKRKGIKIKAFDIDPKKRNIQKKDFLKQKIKINRNKDEIVVIGNPPFGKRGKTALEFIKTSLNYANFVCFILPNIFRKYSMQKLLPNDIKIIFEKELPKNSFYTEQKENVDIGCVFQIFTNKNSKIKDKRIRKQPPISHPDFELYQYNNTKEALKFFKKDFDIAVFSQGYGEYPTIKTKSSDCSKKKQWLLIKAKKTDVLSKIKKIDFKKLANRNTTVKGFRKADFVQEYIRLYD